MMLCILTPQGLNRTVNVLWYAKRIVWLLAAYDNDMMLSIIHIVHAPEIIYANDLWDMPEISRMMRDNDLGTSVCGAGRLSGCMCVCGLKWSPCGMEYGDRMEELPGRYVFHLLEVITITLLPEETCFAERAEAVLHDTIRKRPKGVVGSLAFARFCDVPADCVMRENDPAPLFLIHPHQKFQHCILSGRGAVPLNLARQIELVGSVDQLHQEKA